MIIGKKVIYFVFISLLTFFNISSYAEDLAGFEISSSPSSKCSDYIVEIGFVEGEYRDIGGQNVMLICGSADIKASPSQRIFIGSRQVGYEQAILNAKANYAKFMGTYISNEISNIIESGSLNEQGDRDEKMSLTGEGSKLFDKLIALAHNEVDHLLEERGVEDPSKQPQIAEEEIKKMVMSEEFKKVTSTFANSQIAGLQVNKVFESCEKGSKQCEIALAMAWSENSAALANSLFNSISSIAPKGKKGKPIKERIPTSHEDVLANIGARLYLDENGNYHIISIATSMPKSDTKSALNLAKKTAKIKASSYIRQFTSETTSSAEKLIEAQNYKEFADGSEDIAYDDYYSEKLVSKSDALEIKGISPFKDGTFRHPANPELTGVWVAVRWSSKSMVAAQETKKIIENKYVEEETESEEETKSENTESDTTTEIESDSSDF